MAAVLDVGIVVLSVTVVTAPEVLQPLLSRASPQDVSTAVIWVGNLMLLGLAVWVFYRLPAERTPAGVALIATSLVAFTLLAGFQAALEAHTPGEVPWFVTLAYTGPYLLLWVAPHLDTLRTRAPYPARPGWSLARLVLPYAVFVPLVAMWFSELIAGRGASLIPMAAAVLGVSVLVVARQLVLVADHRRLLQELSEQALRDGLTGLFNRRAFDADISAFIAAAQRRSGHLALVSVDVDSLKIINDACGHTTGDAVIRAVAEALESSVRRGDRIYRVGGDEFAALLVDGGADAAERVADRVRLSLQTHELGCLTISAGWAVYPEDADEPELLRIAADQSLYSVKQMPTRRHRSSPPLIVGTRVVPVSLRQERGLLG